MILTREEALALCLRFPFAWEDHPFDDPDWTAVRHRENRKIFALIFHREGRVWINLKAEPMWGDFWRQAYPAVLPGYHMNKRHWISVIPGFDVPDGQIEQLITLSYDITAARADKIQR